MPLGVRADTGKARPRLSVSDALQVIASPDLTNAPARARSQGTLAPDASVDDLNDLSQTGWAVLFASDADPAIKQQLQPLLDLRKLQVEKDLPPGQRSRFRIFDGADPYTGGVLPGQGADDWARLHGVNFTSPVDPDKVPYYLLIVGSPARISFDFHATFKLQWLVGRLHFDDLNDYGRYAAHVVAYETPAWKPLPAKNAAVWLTANPGDIATAMLSGTLAADFRDSPLKLGARSNCGFSLDCFVGEQATKQQLQDILMGKLPKGNPSIIFTGSHGSEFAIPSDAPGIELQRQLQGSLITQEWIPNNPVSAACTFTAKDIPESNTLPGTMVFLFACYSAGCPALDNYYFSPDGSSVPVAPAPLISLLAQKLLVNGALAVIGHVDRAFPYGFVDINGMPQANLIRTPLERLMQGWTAGRSIDSFTTCWSAMAAMLEKDAPATALAATLKKHIARDDARNYVALGDPAVRLRVKDDTA